jgi:hypothetical protein
MDGSERDFPPLPTTEVENSKLRVAGCGHSDRKSHPARGSLKGRNDLPPVSMAGTEQRPVPVRHAGQFANIIPRVISDITIAQKVILINKMLRIVDH